MSMVVPAMAVAVAVMVAVVMMPMVRIIVARMIMTGVVLAGMVAAGFSLVRPVGMIGMSMCRRRRLHHLVSPPNAERRALMPILHGASAPSTSS